MFLHCFKYAFRDYIRNKVMLFWVILFPMILGTLFNFAFMSIYDQEKFTEIPVALVNGCKTGGICGLLESMEDNNLLNVRCENESEALTMLESGDIDGIIYDDLLEPSLTVRTGSSMNASILKAFLDRYRFNAKIVADVSAADPAKLPALIDAMQQETAECLELRNLSQGNMNPYTAYFYNLLAMACMFVSMVGMLVSINQQANLSAVGARRSVAPASRFVQTFAGLAAALIIFFLGIALATAYLFFVLRIDFGIAYPEALAVNFVGVLFGVSMGFFVGSIGRMTEGVKTAVLLAVSLGTGFLSGLMMGDMPMIVEDKCPLLNRINPSRLISDSYYAINSYGWNGRVQRNLIVLTVMALALSTGGCLLTRKQNFKSL